MTEQGTEVIYSRPTPAEALVELIDKRFGLTADLGAVQQRRSRTFVLVGDIHFTLVVPDHSALGLDVEFSTLRCKVCGWATIAKICRDLGELTNRITIHYSAHVIEQYADLGNGEKVPA